jgi:hypothetical protein
MVSDLIYYCRVKGQRDWHEAEDHPCRPLDGVARIWARSKSLADKTTVEVMRFKGDNIQEFEYIEGGKR